MSISTSRDEAIDGYEAVQAPSQAVAASRGPAMFRRRSIQPSRRAVLHVQADGDPAVLADLASWYTERAFHFYLAGLRLPGKAALAPGRGGKPGRHLEPAFADLDAACAQLRDCDGMDIIIVMAQRRAALAAALWSDARPGPAGIGKCDPGLAPRCADALVLYAPALPATPTLRLDIACPVLVLDMADSAARPRLRGRWRRRAEGPAVRLGRHVTWLHVPDQAADGAAGASAIPAATSTAAAAAADPHVFFTELGRWLGAYMYAPLRDQLL
jgi:hypothetical protein